jgi:hypothetical protein
MFFTPINVKVVDAFFPSEFECSTPWRRHGRRLDLIAASHRDRVRLIIVNTKCITHSPVAYDEGQSP